MDINEAAQKLKALSHELGKVPTRLEFFDSGATETSIRRLGWENIVRAAGFDLADIKRKRKVTNQIFEKSIFEHVENYEPREFKSAEIDQKVLVIGDLHFPFVHKPGLEMLYQFAKDTKPDVIIQVGDAYDMYAFSKFPRSQNIYSPMEEERLGREGLENMWKRLQMDNPQARCVMLLGNHDVRPVKRALESLPTHEHIVEKHLRELVTFDGVETIYDSRDEFELMGIYFHHGYMTGLGQHRDAALCNFVAGHTHKGGVSYRRIRNETLWELNAGFLGDPESKVFSYTAAKKTSNYTLGWGFIDKYGPRFIHL